MTRIASPRNKDRIYYQNCSPKKESVTRIASPKKESMTKICSPKKESMTKIASPKKESMTSREKPVAPVVIPPLQSTVNNNRLLWETVVGHQLAGR